MKRENGFTLIELLAALLAGSIILVTLSWSIASLGKMYSGSTNLAREAEFAAASDALQMLIEPVHPGSVQLAARHFEALTSPPMAAGGAGPVKLDLRVTPTRTGQALVARIEPQNANDPFPASLRTPQILLSSLRAIQFEYGETDTRTGLPRWMSVHVRDVDRTERQITVIPRVTSDGSCRYDPITLSCR